MRADELDAVIDAVARERTVVADEVGADLVPRVLDRMSQAPRRRRRLVTVLAATGAAAAALGVAVIWVVTRQAEVPVDEPPPPSRLVWVDSAGQEQPVLGGRVASYENARVSPDGRFLAVVERVDGERRLLVREAPAETPEWAAFQVRTVGGRSLVWGRQDGGPALYVQSGPAEWTNDGRTDWWGAAHTGAFLFFLVGSDLGTFADVMPGRPQFVVEREVPGRGLDIELVGTPPRGTVTPLVATPFNESNPNLSPDGRWIAYQSDASGRPEIYVRPVPEGERQWTVSVDGGVQPRWSPDGSAIYFIGPAGQGQAAMMRVPVRAEADLQLGRPEALFDVGSYERATTGIRTYDVAPDGRFLMIRPAEPRPK